MQYEIKKASISDLDQIYQIELLCFNSEDVFDKKTFRFFLLNRNTICLKAMKDNRILGFLIVYRKQNLIFEIVTIDVHPKWQNKGIGKGLLLEMETIVKRELLVKDFSNKKNQKLVLELVVYEKNDPAIHLYKKLGYQKKKVIKNYYSRKRNGIKMLKKINLN